MSYEAARNRLISRLEDIREKKNMDNREFSAYLGLSAYTYDYWKYKGGMPTLYTTMIIAEKLGMTLDQLLGIGGKKK